MIEFEIDFGTHEIPQGFNKDLVNIIADGLREFSSDVNINFENPDKLIYGTTEKYVTAKSFVEAVDKKYTPSLYPSDFNVIAKNTKTEGEYGLTRIGGTTYYIGNMIELEN